MVNAFAFDMEHQSANIQSKASQCALFIYVNARLDMDKHTHVQRNFCKNIHTNVCLMQIVAIFIQMCLHVDESKWKFVYSHILVRNCGKQYEIRTWEKCLVWIEFMQ